MPDTATSTSPATAADGVSLGALFRSVWDACLACGISFQGARGHAATCADAFAARELLDLGQPTGLVGRSALVRPGTLRRSAPLAAVVVSAEPKRVEVVAHDGSLATVPRRRIELNGLVPGGGRASCRGGELLAASLGEHPEPVRQLLRDRALAYGRLGPAEKRRLARDAVVLGVPDLLADLQLADSEQVWWRALGHWWARRPGEASTTLLELPTRRYPMQLAVWWSLATDGAVPDGARREVTTALDALGDLSPECAVAALAVTRSLVATGPQSHRRGLLDEPLVTAAQRVFDRDRRAWLRHRPEEKDGWLAVRKQVRRCVGDSAACRVQDAWQLLPREPGPAPSEAAQAQVAKARDRLGGDVSILDEMPTAVLDDFVDAGALPPEWAAHAGELACGDYLHARTDIGKLDDAALVRLGAQEERARRVVAAGGRVPDDIPPPERERLRLDVAAAVAAGDDDLLVRRVRDAGFDGDALARALAEPATVPDGRLLDTPAVASVLLERSAIDGPAVGHLRPELLDDPQRLFVSQVLLRRSKRALHEWDWEGALDLARQCLRIARVERQRDEALNLLAAAHWELGNDEEAIKALLVALEGAYTAALQANIAVVAAELEPRTAATHLARLVQEAPDLHLRVSAAKQVLLIWGHNQQLWLDSDTFPPEIATALRSIVVGPIDEADFRQIVRLLAEHDAQWLARPEALAGSPHAGSAAARVWAGRARGVEAFVRELAQCLREPAPEEWLEGLRDELVDAALRTLGNQGETTAANFALLLLSEDLPMGPQHLVVLTSVAVSSAVAGIDPSQAEPGAKLLDWLERASRRLVLLPPQERSGLDTVLQLAYDALAAAYLRSRARQLDDVAQVVAIVNGRVLGVPRHLVNTRALREITDPALRLCDDTVGLLMRLRRHVSASMGPAIDEMTSSAGRHREHLRMLAR